ncbi:MAG: SDR family oxidoreductase [Bacteroidota bacterium]
MRDVFNIKGKNILVTGGTGVLGSEWSKYLAAQGANLIILGRKWSEAQAFVDEIVKGGGKATAFSCDVTDEDSLKSVSDTLKSQFGHLDVLINAAGGNMAGAVITPDQSLLDSDVEALRKIIDLNYVGTYLSIKSFLPLFLDDKKGSVINISSMSAERPLTRVMGYSSAKAAIDNLTKWLAVEFAKKYGEGLRVNAVAPGFFLTKQNKELLTNTDGSYTDRANQIICNTPMSRFGQPNELFGAIHYLSSDASKFVTGTVLSVDGGFGAYSGV